MITHRGVLTGSSYLSMFFLGVGTAVIGAASGNIGHTPLPDRAPDFGPERRASSFRAGLGSPGGQLRQSAPHVGGELPAGRVVFPLLPVARIRP